MCIKVSELTKSFDLRGGKKLVAIDRLSLTIEHRSFVCIVGPSGCGKTTLLRILAGLELPSEGNIDLGSGHVNSGVGMVLQDYSRSLFPWLTVEGQLMLACRARRLSRSRTEELVDEALRITGLSDYRHMLPRQLSGGMQQRVAIARGLAMEPGILLLDEPFGSVDALTRYRLEDDLLKWWEVSTLTAVMVTHDIDEAVYLADRVIVMSPRPARVVLDIEIKLPRPRRQDASRMEPTFGVARRMVWEALQDER